MQQNWSFSRVDECSPEVLSVSENGITKYLEDPHDPGSDAVKAIGHLQEKVSILILPPCSIETIKALSEELPCLNHIVVVDTREQRLEAWKQMAARTRIDSISTLLLSGNINYDNEQLRQILYPYPIAVHLWKVIPYIPRRFLRIDREFPEYLEQLLQFAESKVRLTVNYQSGEAWHHIVNQMVTLQDVKLRNFTINPQTEKRSFVIAGAGPSLDDNIEILKEYRDRVVILACDRAVGTFKRHGIKPDFVVSVENILLMWRHYEQHVEFLKDVPLICPWMVSHVVARNYPGDVISLKVTGNDEWLETFGGRLVTNVGNCVGHYTYHIAAVLNPENIILIGNDLALKDGRSHTASTFSDIKQAHRGIYTKGYYGEEVETTETFYHYIQKFENYFRDTPWRVINATEGGAFLEGAIHQPLLEALEQLPAVSSLPYVEIPQQDVQSFYEGIVNDVKQLKDRLEQSLSEIDAINCEKPSPFFSFITDRMQVLLNHFLPPTLYLQYYDILQNYLPSRCDAFKDIITQLIDESVRGCEFVLTLDRACRYNDAVESNCLLLITEGTDVAWLRKKYAQLSFWEMPALSHLPDIWDTIVEHKIGTVISFDSRVIPDTWSVPNIMCVDVMISGKCGKVFRTPGYQVVALDDETMERWDWNHRMLSRFERMTVDQYFSKLIERAMPESVMCCGAQ